MMSVRTTGKGLKITLFLYLTFATSYIAYSQTIPCPECFSDVPVMSGHGAARDLPASFNCNCPGDARRVIIVRIDSSWDVSPGNTDPSIWNAVTCAIDQWNTVQDPTGYTTGYYFVIDQAHLINAPADITIYKATPSNPRAWAEVIINPGSPYIMKVRADNSGRPSDELCGRIAHEIGHSIGLANASGCTSVMVPSYSDGTRPPANNRVTSNDVYRVNRHFDNRSQCTTTSQGRPYGDCPDQDGDGVCSEYDCDDNNPDIRECVACVDNDGDGWCSGTDCNDNDPTITDCGGYWGPDPDPGGSGGGYCYHEYSCTDYYTCTGDKDNMDCEYAGTDCYEEVGYTCN